MVSADEYIYNDKKYNIEIVRKNNKNTYLRVRDNKIIVSTNYFTTKKQIIKLIEDNVINRGAAKEVFEEMFKLDVDPEKYVEEHGMKQDNDEDALREIVKKVIEENPKAVEDVRSGKGKAIGALVGQTMKATQGKANPGVVNKLLKELI